MMKSYCKLGLLLLPLFFSFIQHPLTAHESQQVQHSRHHGLPYKTTDAGGGAYQSSRTSCSKAAYVGLGLIAAAAVVAVALQYIQGDSSHSHTHADSE